MNPCMYLVMASPQTTPMSPGKLAAQAAHAAVEAWQISDKNSQVVNRWYCGGHYMKIVLMADNLEVAERYIKDRGFKTALIIDEGRTEFEGDLTPTAIGVEIVDKDELHVRETFSAFSLYSVPPETDAELIERIEKLREVNHYSLSPELRKALKEPGAVEPYKDIIEFEHPVRRPKPNPSMGYLKRRARFPWKDRDFS